MSTPAYLTKDKPFPKIDFGDLPFELSGNTPEMQRRRAEEEAARDLSKCYHQLFADVHDEIMTANTPDVRIMLANRRIAAITTRAAITFDEASKESRNLQKELNDLAKDFRKLSAAQNKTNGRVTLGMSTLTIAGLVFAILSWVVAARALALQQEGLDLQKAEIASRVALTNVTKQNASENPPPAQKPTAEATESAEPQAQKPVPVAAESSPRKPAQAPEPEPQSLPKAAKLLEPSK